MATTPATINGLKPLPYQSEVLAYLQDEEPDVWAWASSLSVQEQHSNEVRAQLLRDTYRLTTATHAQTYELCQLALERLQIQAPVTLYQASGSEMNATLFFLPGEVHVVLQGPVLERLASTELLSLLGHELAHYKLWSEHNGEYLIADRVLNHSVIAQSGSNGYNETARLYGLHTELYADRGGALAAQSCSAAISMLVKVHTGAAEVDALAYLQQALELDEKAGRLSQGASHPESFLRSQAIDLWWRQDEQLDAWLQKRLRGPLQLYALDLTGQVELTRITREFIARFLQSSTLQTDEVLTQVKQYFPDWQQNTAPINLATLNNERIDPSVQEYLHYVMLDLALVDDSLRDAALLQAITLAAEMGSKEGFMQILKRDLKMNKRELSKLEKNLNGSISA